MKRLLSLLCTLWLVIAPANTWAASAATTDTGTATLLSNVSTINKEPFWLAVQLKLQNGWHTYWQNAGDSGIPASLDWQLPEGFKADAIQWQAPELILIDQIVNFGYHDGTVLLVRITPPATLPATGDYTFTANANWLVCKEVCIPESATLDIILPAAAEATPSNVDADFKQWIANLPQTLTTHYDYAEKEGMVEFSIPLADLHSATPHKILFYPAENGVVNNLSEFPYTINNNNLTFRLPRGPIPLSDHYPVLIGVQGDAASPMQYYNITLDRTATSTTTQPATTPAAAAEKPDITFLGAVLAAVLGGLILNIMPCVLPVLSLKALAISRKAQAKHSEVIAQGLAYTAGIILSFVILAGILILLQKAGQAVDWGYQMQSPIFVLFLIYLMFMVGLNLSGVFNLPVLFGSAGSSITQKDNALGSFATGVLATLVATPCTAPFMAPALGFALTQPPLQAQLIFVALGFGLALPYLLVSLFPKLVGWIPKPGAWMDNFKQFLAFPMYATAAWLLWVLTQQTGADGLFAALVGCVLISFSLWLLPRLNVKPLARLIFTIVLIGASLYPITFLNTEKACALPVAQEIYATEPFSAARIEALRAEGTPLLVDATAAWCITCQYNERTALRDAEVEKLFAEKKLVFMKADWTRKDPAITHYLQSFNRRGVPLYVYYAPHKEPVILPQLLTPSIVKEAIQ